MTLREVALHQETRLLSPSRKSVREVMVLMVRFFLPVRMISHLTRILAMMSLLSMKIRRIMALQTLLWQAATLLLFYALTLEHSKGWMKILSNIPMIKRSLLQSAPLPRSRSN